MVGASPGCGQATDGCSSLERSSAIGRRHRAQSNNGVKVQRLRKTDYITGADAKTIKGMIRAR